MNAAIDMSAFIEAKSDQLNADDLMGGPRTVTVTAVKAHPDSAEQPISISYQGDDGKPFKPCKTMRRVMVAVWGADASQYVGRSMTLYRDAKVSFGGMQVGGIRISHMSHMEREMVVAAMVTRGKKAPFKILPLKEQPRQQQNSGQPSNDVQKWADDLIARIRAAESADAIVAIENEGNVIKRRQWLEGTHPELAKRITEAFADGPAVQGRTDAQHGEQFPGDDASDNGGF